MQLNVFHFLAAPYNPNDITGRGMPREKRNELAIAAERQLRVYYDERAGDYLDVGFRLCEENEWTELHRCLRKKEFQVLVLGCPGEDAVFCKKPILEFVNQFIAPIVLIGPRGPEVRYLNPTARLIADSLAA